MTEVGFFQHSGVQLSDVPGPYLDGQSPVESETRTDPTACTAKDPALQQPASFWHCCFTSQRMRQGKRCKGMYVPSLTFLSHLHIDYLGYYSSFSWYQNKALDMVDHQTISGC